MSDTSIWADLSKVRDQINRAAYRAPPRRNLLPYALSSLLFLGLVEVARRSFFETIFEFILGSILLFLSQLVIRRLQNLRKPRIDGSLNAAVLRKLDAPSLGMLQALLELRAQGVREFPIQQNALLVIALVVLPSFDHGDRNALYGRLLINVFFGACFFGMKLWEDSRSQVEHWRNAARAVAETLRKG